MFSGSIEEEIRRIKWIKTSAKIFLFTPRFAFTLGLCIRVKLQENLLCHYKVSIALKLLPWKYEIKQLLPFITVKICVSLPPSKF